MPIVLLPDEYGVSYLEQKVKLLPKEFALFQFLYQYSGQTFTREQLLDQVWKMENPVDRTVDDHIYRLRKKLRKLGEMIKIETVRGLGYRLVLQLPVSTKPSHQSETVTKIYQLWSDYHRQGKGESLRLLAENQAVLGFELTSPYLSVFKACQGDIDWFLTTDEVELGERLYSLGWFHYFMKSKPEQTLLYIQNAIKKKLLPDFMQLEVEILNMLEVLVDAGMVAEALERLEYTHKTVKQYHMSAFIIPVALTECRIYMFAGDWKQVEQQLAYIEQLLSQTPDMRELGYFHLLKGAFYYQLGRKQEGRKLIDQSWEISKQTQMVFNMFAHLHILLVLCDRIIGCQQLQQDYSLVFDNLMTQYGFKGKVEQVEMFLDQSLL